MKNQNEVENMTNDNQCNDAEFLDRLSQKDLEHKRILERLAVTSRSNKCKIIDYTRLNVIRDELKGSLYQETQGDLCSIWSKVPIHQLKDKDIILVSSHVDIVDDMTQCFSILQKDGFYKGTYDNEGTNAAITILMRENDIPENVVFAFTGEEERCTCAGAINALKILYENVNSISCIALDVTYEGYRSNQLMSLENMSPSEKDPVAWMDKTFADILMTEPESKTFCFIRKEDTVVPSTAPLEYIENAYAMFDEATAYAHYGLPSMSLCLPCNGPMHSNSGVEVKQPVFEGYVISVASVIYAITKTHKKEIEQYKRAKQDLYEKAQKINKTIKKDIRPVTGNIKTESYDNRNAIMGIEMEDDDMSYDDYLSSMRKSNCDGSELEY